MTAADVLDRLAELGINAWIAGEKLLLEPGSKVPPELFEEVRQHKAEILSTIRRRMVGDGQAPPLDRPPATERELRRWMDHTADPEVFDRWLAWAMSYSDPVEE